MTSFAPAADWREYAACQDADVDDFFPVAHPSTDAYKRQAAAALKTCGTCPVRVPCGDYAVGASEAQGIWGGLDEAERTGRRNLTRGVA